MSKHPPLLPSSTPPSTPSLNTSTHVRYWLRCLKTLLPNAYTEQDATRIPLAFFTLSALDLLDSLDAHTTPTERAQWADFLYSCQHSDGGFRAFTGSKYGERTAAAGSGRWDPANVAGTYFAIVSLVLLGDDLGRLDRAKTLDWVQRLQNEDGSFGELLAGNGTVDGGQDVRFCFMAALVCHTLRGKVGQDTFPEGIDQAALARFVLSSKGYDGGVAKNPHCESHAGCTYCGVSTLAILGRLPSANGKKEVSKSKDDVYATESDIQDLLHWLVWRQTSMLSDYRDLDGLEDSEAEFGNEEHLASFNLTTESGFEALRSEPASTLPPFMLDFESLHPEPSWDSTVGFDGRCNKPADTCYSFWAGGTLAVLGQSSLINVAANRRYLLEKTQHRIGGFGKFPNDPPDVLHSYMALASLSIMGEPGLKPLDPLLCVSLATKERLDRAHWRQ